METIDDYELIRLEGQGSFASVYLAKHKSTGEEVALKQVFICSFRWFSKTQEKGISNTLSMK